MKSKRSRLVALTLAAALGASGLTARHAANAATATANLTVQATVVASCTISTTTLTFTGYDPVFTNLTAANDSTGSLIVACTSGTGATIGLGQGNIPAAGSSTTTPLRQMANGTNRLPYFLFQDAARSVVWGDIGGGAGALVAYNSVTAAPTTFTVYGRINAAQDVPVGSYLDTVLATVQF